MSIQMILFIKNWNWCWKCRVKPNNCQYLHFYYDWTASNPLKRIPIPRFRWCWWCWWCWSCSLSSILKCWWGYGSWCRQCNWGVLLVLLLLHHQHILPYWALVLVVLGVSEAAASDFPLLHIKTAVEVRGRRCNEPLVTQWENETPINVSFLQSCRTPAQWYWFCPCSCY